MRSWTLKHECIREFTALILPYDDKRAKDAADALKRRRAEYEKLRAEFEEGGGR